MSPPNANLMVSSIGASYGTTFSIWDLADLHGGKPNITGVSFPDGSAQFKYASPHASLGSSTYPP